MISKTEEFIGSQLIPILPAYAAAKKLFVKLEVAKQVGFDIEVMEDANKDNLKADLQAIYSSEEERKKVLEDKAKSILFVITISSSLILGSVGVLRDGIFPQHKFLFVVFAIGISYFVLSGVACIASLNIRGFHKIVLNDYIRKSENGQIFLGDIDDDDKIALLYQCSYLNEMILCIKSNFVDAAYILVRNALILILLFFIGLIIKSAFMPSDNDQNKNLPMASVTINCSQIFQNSTSCIRKPGSNTNKKTSKKVVFTKASLGDNLLIICDDRRFNCISSVRSCK